MALQLAKGQKDVVMRKAGAQKSLEDFKQANSLEAKSKVEVLRSLLHSIMLPHQMAQMALILDGWMEEFSVAQRDDKTHAKESRWQA